VPFYVRAGKCLPVTTTEVRVELRRPPQVVFDEVDPGPPNAFHFAVDPKVAISLDARVKAPGEAMVGEDARLVAVRRHEDEMQPYERLLGDALRGDHTLFGSQESAEAAWRVFDQVLDDATPVCEYEPASWGPREANRLVADDGGWHAPTGLEAAS
jgi:glucose-6-phosphate 1-dehydrogenase